MKGISLRYKLLAALTVIPLLGLSLFLLLAVSIFEKDKIAYIFDSSLSVSKTRGARVSSEVESAVSLTQAVVLSYRSDTKNLAESGTYYFQREAKLEAFQLHALNPDTGAYEKTVNLAKDPVKAVVAGEEAMISELINQVREQGIVIRRPQDVQNKIVLGARFGEVTDPRHVIAITFFDARELSQVFNDKGPYRGFLARKDGTPVFAGTESSLNGWDPKEIWSELSKRKTPEGIAEMVSPAGERYLVSFVDTGVADLVVVSMVNRTAALQAIDVLIRKSLLFFIAVISMTTIIAVAASRGLTSTLSRLSSATQKVAEGDFGVRVEVKGGGEIGVLATSFNTMAEEVSRLMKETAEKARMESELATAKAVQETLFPESHVELGTVEISGHYVPASECGGDWWYYCENGDKVYVWIGDATGHGAPAALLTSAARAVASVITFGPPLSCSESLGILNRAICETSKGKMMMTFFLACIDKHTGMMTYANASHEPPFLLHRTEAEPERGDFISLNDINNPRLGERLDHAFNESAVQLLPGDRIVFYTDGVVDVKNPERKAWGERRFLKSLSAEMAQTFETEPVLGGVVKKIETFRADTPLDDDVTLILCSYRGAA